jgi:TP901 family phage tail tape measure protein
MNLGSLNVKIGVDTRDLQAGVAGAKQQVQQLAASMSAQTQAVTAADRALREAAASTTSNAERSRQLTAASRELTAARARLAEVMGGESKIASQVAAKYSGLQNMQRAQLIEVKEQIAALELEARANQQAAAAAVRAQEQKIAAAGKAALAQRAAAESAIVAAEREAAAEVKAALAAGQRAGAEAAAAARAAEGRGSGGALTGIGGYAAIGAAAGLAAAVKASIEFNQQMANVGSLIPGNVQRLGELKQAVQQLAQETGKSTKEISTGAYQIISSFGDTADTAKLLAINTKLAIGGVADVGKTIGLTAAVTKTFGDHSAAAVQHVADLAAMTVRLGHTTLPELNASIGQVAPLASQLNVSMDELFGTLATGSGVTGNMSRVSTQLRGIFAGFENPTKAMVALFNQVGVSSGKALIEQRGFAGAVDLVVKTAERTDTPLQKYFHRIEATTLALPLAGAQHDILKQKIDKMKDAAGASEAAFKAQQTGAAALGTELTKLGQTLTVLAQNFGNAVSPALTKATQGINDFLKSAQKLGGETGRLLPQMSQGLAGVATGHFFPGEDTQARYQQMVDAARSQYLAGLSPTGGRFVGGPVAPTGPAASRVRQPTKAEIDAHNKILSTMAAQAFDTARAKAVQLNGEYSNAVAALDLYHRAYEKLTGAQQHNVRQLLVNLKAEQVSKDAVKAAQEAVDARTKAEEKAREERRKQQEDFRTFLKEQQLAIREANKIPGTAMDQLKAEHPGWSQVQYKKALDTQNFRQFAEAARQSSKAAEEQEQQANKAMQAQLKQAQLDEMSTQARRRYGEVNRETLALDSEWNAHYLNLAPNQQRIIDQLYAIGLVKQYNERQDRIAATLRDQETKSYEQAAAALDREKEAMLDFNKALEARRREQERIKQQKFDQDLQKLGDKLNKPADQLKDKINEVAQSAEGVLVSAFHDAFEHGPQAFFKSVVRGFEQMLQDMAAKYLASQLVNLFFGTTNEAGDRGGGLVGNLIGSLFTHRAGGGPVTAGMPYLVGERGRELFVPSGNGAIVPNGQAAAGTQNITIHVHGVTDANSFRRNTGAITADISRALSTRARRDG